MLQAAKALIMRLNTSDLVNIRPTEVDDPWLRVLFITSMWPDASRPHYGTFIHTQAQSLETMGMGVDVIAIRGYVSPLAYPAALRTILRQRRARAYDLTHVHTGHAAAVATVAVRPPVVISYVGGDLLGHPNERGITTKSRVEAFVFRQLARRAAATITKSAEMERALPRSLRVRNHVIPNGVNLEAFDPRPRTETRTTLGWDQDESVALFLGDPDDPRKNISLARAAIAEIQKTDTAVRLHVGWGVSPSEIPNLMWAADALVLPSRSEGSPNVVKEAMAATLPIVATPVGDVPERLDGVAGCFVVRPEPHDFAEALKLALNFGRSTAARQAVRDLSLTAIANRVMRLYEQVSGIQRELHPES
jgi:glycosyltransferase involved in cell wall biosynthesis